MFIWARRLSEGLLKLINFDGNPRRMIFQAARNTIEVIILKQMSCLSRRIDHNLILLLNETLAKFQNIIRRQNWLLSSSISLLRAFAKRSSCKIIYLTELHLVDVEPFIPFWFVDPLPVQISAKEMHFYNGSVLFLKASTGEGKTEVISFCQSWNVPTRYLWLYWHVPIKMFFFLELADTETWLAGHRPILLDLRVMNVSRLAPCVGTKGVI